MAVAAIMILAGGLRLWQVDAIGYNSDEAVYAGQAASMAHDPQLAPFFPTFRAHPLLFQTILSLGYQAGFGDWFGRVLAALFGCACVYVTYRIGSLLYGPTAGVLAALFLAAMPYHVVVSRQVLLDGPMTFFATVTLYLLVRFSASGRPGWLYAAAATMGLTVLTKETSVLLLGAVYAFVALTPQVRIRLRWAALAAAAFVAVILPYPLALMFSGRSSTGGAYLSWQLFRRPNHTLLFYLETVPPAVGLLLLATAAVGIVALRREGSWRERLLLSWVIVPVVFFELWPVKGYQYLLPAAPAVAVLAARLFTRLRPANPVAAVALPALAGVLVLSLLLPSISKVGASSRTTFLAGSGGVPGGRELGRFIERLPQGSRFIAIGPSMANIIQFYGHRQAFGLSVSPNPLHRNPSYEPVVNPDLQIRRNEVQYLVWDSYSAARTPFFTRRLMSYVERYHGRAIHTESVSTRTADGASARRPVMVVYEVRP